MPESGGDSDTKETHFQHMGGANPVSLRSTAPSRGRGENVGRFECIDPSFLWKEVPAGRRLGAQSGMKEDDADGKTFLHKSLLTRVPYPPLRGTGGMKESGKERLKQAIYESTRMAQYT